MSLTPNVFIKLPECALLLLLACQACRQKYYSKKRLQRPLKKMTENWFSRPIIA